MPPAPLKPGKGWAMMIFGPPGAGKTRLLGSGSRVLIVHPPTDHTDSITPPATGVDEWVIDDWSGMYDVKHFIQQGGHKDYDIVSWDSISIAQDFLLDDVLEDAIMRKPARAMEKGEHKEKVAEYGSDKGEYKINFDRIRQFVGDMVGFSKKGMFNFIVTAHPFEWYNPVTEQELWAPWVRGKDMSNKICGYMNIVAYMADNNKEDKERQEVLTVDSDGFVGKDQFNCFPKLKSGRHGFINPTMADIEAAINKKRGRRPSGRRRKPANKRKK